MIEYSTGARRSGAMETSHVSSLAYIYLDTNGDRRLGISFLGGVLVELIELLHSIAKLIAIDE